MGSAIVVLLVAFWGAISVYLDLEGVPVLLVAVVSEWGVFLLNYSVLSGCRSELGDWRGLGGWLGRLWRLGRGRGCHLFVGMAVP